MNEKGEKNKIKNKNIYKFFYNMPQYTFTLQQVVYCKKKKKGFSPSNEAWILVFGMINVKNLAFSIYHI